MKVNQKRILGAILASAVLIAIVSLLATSSLENQHGDRGIGPIGVGTTMVYSFFVHNIAKPGINSLAANSTLFHVVLRANEAGIVNQFRELGGYQLNESSDCRVDSDGLSLRIAVTKYEVKVYTLNTTLVFSHGRATCGRDFSNLPLLSSFWTFDNGTYTSRFAELNFSRQILASGTSSNAESPGGAAYGEWPFWLNPLDLKMQYSVVLYGMNVTSTPFGPQTASVIPLNLSEHAPTDFEASGVFVPRENQIFMDKGFLPLEQVIPNVPPVLANGLLQDLASPNSYGICARVELVRCNPAFIPSGTNLLHYTNDSVVAENSSIMNAISIPYKNWTFRPSMITYESATVAGNSSYPTITHVPGLVYAGDQYVTFGFSGTNQEVSFARVNGLLLNASLSSEGDFFQILPAPIARAYGIVPWLSLYSGDSISITLTGTEQ